jgi:putative effector of murein hydrolase
LTLSGTPYPSYFSGAQFIRFLLGPAVVALAAVLIPLIARIL